MPSGSKPGERRGGRTPGTPNRKTIARILRTQKYVEDAHNGEGIAPLGVMLANLAFYHNSAVALTEKLQAVAETLTPEMIAAGGDEMVELCKLIAKVGDFRMKAQACAVDAAPYVHPKLASIELKQSSDKPMETIRQIMSTKEAAKAYVDSMDAVAVPSS